MAEIMRLDKLFSQMNICSRKEIKKHLKNGDIKVNGETVKQADLKIYTQKDEVLFFNKKVEYSPYVYIMLNKPKGVVSATEDKLSKTVLDLVPESLKRKNMFPAGRLDKDTTGFVLITNDGDFAHRILSPKNHIEKTYEAVISGKVTENHIEEFKKGIKLYDGTLCLSADLKIIKDQAQPLVEIKICEGKYHQIKRMFGSLGLKVLELKRTKMGDLELDANLKEGECREIMHKEVQKILCKNF